MKRNGRLAIGSLAIALITSVSAVFSSGAAMASPVPTVIIADAGDSFTSGPGTGISAEDRSVYVNGSGSNGNQCYQSSRGFPQRIVDRLKANNPGTQYFLTHTACAGATTDNVLNAHQRVVNGQTVAVPAQVDQIPVNANYVVLTIGGNDIGFVDMVSCIVNVEGLLNPYPECTEASPAIQRVRAAMQTVRAKITAAIAAIQTRAPQAQVLIGGYPQIVPTEAALATGCFPWLSPGERVLANALELELNGHVAAAAEARGAVYVKQYKALPYRTTACSVGVNRQINGVVIAAPEAAFHPNNQGAHASSVLFGQAIQ